MRYNCRQIPLHRPLIGSFHSSHVEREICHVPDGCARHIGLCISHSIKEGRTKREEFGKCRKSSEKDLDGGETFLIFKQQQTRKKEKKRKMAIKRNADKRIRWEFDDKRCIYACERYMPILFWKFLFFLSILRGKFQTRSCEKDRSVSFSMFRVLIRAPLFMTLDLPSSSLKARSHRSCPGTLLNVDIWRARVGSASKHGNICSWQFRNSLTLVVLHQQWFILRRR